MEKEHMGGESARPSAVFRSAKPDIAADESIGAVSDGMKATHTTAVAGAEKSAVEPRHTLVNRGATSQMKAHQSNIIPHISSLSRAN